MRWRQIVLLTLLSGLASCDILGAGDPVCDICTLTARVRGEVLTTNGVAVSGAVVTFRALYSSFGGLDTCGGEGRPAQGITTATTDEAGIFDQTIGGTSIDGPFCVEIAVAPDSSSGLSPRVDSVRATFVLPGETPPPIDVTLVLELR